MSVKVPSSDPKDEIYFWVLLSEVQLPAEEALISIITSSLPFKWIKGFTTTTNYIKLTYKLYAHVNVLKRENLDQVEPESCFLFWIQLLL